MRIPEIREKQNLRKGEVKGNWFQEEKFYDY